MRSKRFGVFVALAVGLLAIMFRDALLHGYILGQTDFLFRYLPWSVHAPVGWRVRNPLMGDVPMQFYPWAAHARDELLAGRFPLWNAAAAAGQPFFAAVQTQVLSPFSLLIYALPFPASLTAVAWARLLVGGCGMFLFLQRLQLSDAAAAFGGLAYLLNPFSVVGLEHPTAAVAAWLPWALLSADACATEGNRRSVAMMAIVVALAVLSGHPESFQNIALMTIAYAVYRGASNGRLVRTVAVSAAGSVLGLLLASVQILPFLEYVRGSEAVALRSRLPPLLAPDPPAAFVTAFVPDFYGTPVGGRRYVLGGSNYVMQTMYPSLAAWLFASIAVFNRRRRGAAVLFLAAAAVAAGIVYGTVVARIAAMVFPPIRLVLLFGFGLTTIASLVIAGAIGFDAFVDALDTDRGRSLTLAAIIAGTAAAIGTIVFAFWRGQQAGLVDSRQAVHTLRSIQWAAELLIFLVALACGARWLGRGATAALATAVLVVDLLVFGDGFHALIPRELAFPPLPELATVTDDHSLFRVAGWGDALLPNTAMMYGLQDFRGYDAVGIDRYGELLAAGFHWTGAGYQLWNGSSFPMLDLFNVKYVLAPPDIPFPAEHFEKLSTGPTTIYRNRRALPRAFVLNETRVLRGNDALRQLRDGSIDLTREALLEEPLDATSSLDATSGTAGDVVAVRRYQDRDVSIDVQVAGRRLLVLLDTYYPGWVATVDRKEVPVHRVDHAFRGVVIPAGRHIIDFHYRPRSVYAGAALSLTALAVVVWLWAGASAEGTRKANRRAAKIAEK